MRNGCKAMSNKLKISRKNQNFNKYVSDKELQDKQVLQDKV